MHKNCVGYNVLCHVSLLLSHVLARIGPIKQPYPSVQSNPADYLTYPDNYFQYASLINDTVNATLPGMPAAVVIRMSLGCPQLLPLPILIPCQAVQRGL
jgi:hypothetical protein